MLQKPGHGSCFSFHDSEIVKEAFKREKKAEKQWKQKYSDEVERERREREQMLGPRKPSSKLSKNTTTSDPEARCIGWGVAKPTRRNLQLEMIRGGVQGDEFQESPYARQPKSVHGRTKRLGADFYDLSGIACFGEKDDLSSDSDDDGMDANRSTMSGRSFVSNHSNRSSVPLGNLPPGVKSPSMKSTYASTIGERK
mmetsp:Transcript_9157/g.33810  ORF Transcript_9157/g.33810 Transcript_9157/m.33810 type:complete len:197 (+) Transcript_9157:182-772(+)